MLVHDPVPLDTPCLSGPRVLLLCIGVSSSAVKEVFKFVIRSVVLRAEIVAGHVFFLFFTSDYFGTKNYTNEHVMNMVCVHSKEV